MLLVAGSRTGDDLTGGTAGHRLVDQAGRTAGRTSPSWASTARGGPVSSEVAEAFDELAPTAMIRRGDRVSNPQVERRVIEGCAIRDSNPEPAD